MLHDERKQLASPSPAATTGCATTLIGIITDSGRAGQDMPRVRSAITPEAHSRIADDLTGHRRALFQHAETGPLLATPAASCQLGFVCQSSGSFVGFSGSLVDLVGSFVVSRVRSQAQRAACCAIRYISIANESLYATFLGFRCVICNERADSLRYTRHRSGSVALYATNRVAASPKHKRCLSLTIGRRRRGGVNG